MRLLYGAFLQASRWRRRPARRHGRLLASLVALCALLLGSSQGVAAPAPTPVLMLSDLHFDPFADPAKLPLLLAAPVSRWAHILREPASRTQAADLAALQTACHARALDTAWPLLHQSFVAAHDAEPRPLFIAVAGDLLTHDFPCRLAHLAPEATPAETAAFASRAVSFVLEQLRAAFPGVPVYAALGNNDAPCGDYRESPGSPFLQQVSVPLAEAAHIPRASLTPEDDYTVALPEPVQHGRLLVLEDIFSARLYSTCSGVPDRTTEHAQLLWLRNQLTLARAAGEQVWVMTHLPTGVDVYNSFRSFLLRPASLCGAEPATYLADTSLAETLVDFSDIVRLVLFGHTHMDELRVLERGKGENSSQEGGDTPIPAKVIPSISPFAGNHPAFLVGFLDPHTAVLKDWQAWVSPGPAGSSAPWAEAYRFSRVYDLPDFSAASAATLEKRLAADPAGKGATAAAFRTHFFAGDIGLYALGLAQIWPGYACAVREWSAEAVHRCVCASVPAEQNR